MQAGIDDEALAEWARRVAAWARGTESKDAEKVLPEAALKRGRRDVYVYFDNDAKVRAPVDAEKLVARVSELLA